MDLIIAIKDEQAFICRPFAVENAREIAERLEREGAESLEEMFSFKRGDTVLDLINNTHIVADIYAPIQAPSTSHITTSTGYEINVLDIKGTVIKEVPKYHLDGLLS